MSEISTFWFWEFGKGLGLFGSCGVLSLLSALLLLLLRCCCWSW